ncbi:hypothetical protein HDV00_007086 [Rhizophlyctis rosea]|nr:hypothetical protein HDV00_007086 [Rhizophlyctis rosea]
MTDYQRYAAGEGMATLAIDRLGCGGSDHPAVAVATSIDNQVALYDAIVGGLKSGHVTGTAYQNVILVGHSAGSFIALRHAQLYPADVAGLVLTGYSHQMQYGSVMSTTLALLPAAVVSPSRFLNFSADYLTTSIPATRESVFYHTNKTLYDPAVFRIDEETKGTTTVEELGSAAEINPTGVSAYNGKVLVLMGEIDNVMCGSTAGRCGDPGGAAGAEVGMWVGADVEVGVVMGVGHVINLHFGATGAWERIVGWVGGVGGSL